MKLILKKFTCLDATTDPGGDSPYFVVFVGKPKALDAGPVMLSELDFQIATVWKAAWDDVIEDGTVRKPNLLVKKANGTPLDIGTNSCVLVALCEQDDNVDVAHEERVDILSDLRTPWVAAGGGVPTSSGPAIALAIRHQFAAIVDCALTNDDLLGASRLVPTAGTHTLKFLSTGDYRYDVVFELQ